MTFEVLFQVAGGLALFLLAMEMMTDGLKQTAGPQLRHILANWTRTPARGAASGMLITGIVQHSGAVTVATIGFVNAGLMTLAQALAVDQWLPNSRLTLEPDGGHFFVYDRWRAILTRFTEPL